MSKIKKTDYLCLSAMLRAKEAKMLTHEKLERIITEPTFADAARALTDCGYEDMSSMDTALINKTLEQHRASEIEEVSQMVPDSEVADLFRLKYEYHNAKVIVKSGGKAEELLSASGRSDVHLLMRVYETGEAEILPETVTHAISEAKVALARTGNPQLADFILDKAYFCELKDIADKSKDSYIRDYVRLLIDGANVRIAVRAMHMGKREDVLEAALIPGGSVEVESIISAASDRESLKQIFADTPFAKALECDGTTAFELACDNAVNAYLAESERRAFGPEVVMGYLAAVENEVMAVRIILTGKLMGIDTKLLRERLRDSYV